jgi:hypothetical protein
MRFEVLIAVKMWMLAFWVVTPCGLGPEDGGNMFLRDVGIYLPVHTALQPKRPTSFHFNLATNGPAISRRLSTYRPSLVNFIRNSPCLITHLICFNQSFFVNVLFIITIFVIYTVQAESSKPLITKLDNGHDSEPVQSTSQPVSPRYILILSSHLLSSLPSDRFSKGFPIKLL